MIGLGKYSRASGLEQNLGHLIKQRSLKTPQQNI
jgi:hypothetical protein